MSVLRPTDEAELADIVAGANAAAASLEIVGGGSKRMVVAQLGATHCVETGALSGILSYEPSELVLTARAGTPLVEISTALALRGQMLAFDPPMLAGATIGGVIAANASGPRRLRQGAARDHFLGFRAVSGRGEAFKAGGKVVKNVTGFDLPKLLAGSWGTLAVLSEVTLKVLPRPASEVTVLIDGLDDASAVALFARLLGGQHEIASATHQAGLTAVRIEGFPSSVAARRGELVSTLDASRVLGAEESAAFWTALRDGEPLADDPRPLWRLMLPPACGPLPGIDGAARFDWGGALLWMRSDVPDAMIEAAARAAGGYARRALGSSIISADPGLAALVERVRAGFDPNCTLNPRRSARELAA